MKILTIDDENGITAFATAAAASTTPFDLFTDQQELAELLASWPAERWVATFNSLPGVKPVKALKDSKTAASKIWECVEKLGRMVAPEPVAAKPEAAPANPKRGKKAKAGLAFESPRAQHCFQRLTRIFPPQTRHLGTSWAQISVPKTDPQRRSTGADSDGQGLDRAGRGMARFPGKRERIGAPESEGRGESTPMEIRPSAYNLRGHADQPESIADWSLRDVTLESWTDSYTWPARPSCPWSCRVISRRTRPR